MARRPTTQHHPATASAPRRRRSSPSGAEAAEALPRTGRDVRVRLADKEVRLTNLDKPFWPELGLSKGDLLHYYTAVSDALLPHVRDRAMVLKRYPNGAAGEHFFMKRAPTPRPDWVRTCAIEHASGNVIDFVIVDDLATLLWVVNLGCIDLNQWYAPCDDVDRPDVLHFDLDPVAKEPAVPFSRVREVALVLRDALARLDMPSHPKTTGSRGMHVYVPIERGPTQKQVWEVARSLAEVLAAGDPERITAQYAVARRPAGRVLIDYNQNAWGRTLASVYSVRPTPAATVSMPVTWDEVEAGVETADFHLRNAPARLREVGDLWAPLRAREGRVRLEPLLRGGIRKASAA